MRHMRAPSLRVVAIFAAAVVLTGCEDARSWHAVPEQYTTSASVPAFTASMIEMSDPEAPLHFVSDIESELHADNWRWTLKRPTINIGIPDVNHLKCSADFSLWEGAFKQTGPVTVSFAVNGRTLAQVRYATAGLKHFEKPVPSDWLHTPGDSSVSAEIDKTFAANDGRILGFILVRMGFVRE